MKADTVKIVLSPKSPEQEARRLRERIYGPISDEQWNSVKDNWTKDVGWLRSMAYEMDRAPKSK